MKFLSKLTFIGLLILAFTACNDDDESPSNHLSYNGNTYELSVGFLSDYGSTATGVQDLGLGFASSGIVYNDSTMIVSGTGNGFFVDLFSSTTTSPTTGTYTYSNTGDAFTFSASSYVFDNYNFDLLSGNEIFIIDGTLNIEKEGDFYKIDLDVELSNNTRATAHYEGSNVRAI